MTVPVWFFCYCPFMCSRWSLTFSCRLRESIVLMCLIFLANALRLKLPSTLILLGRATYSDRIVMHTLRKHAYSNILKILQLKKENFQIKNSDIFHISVRNIDSGYALEPPRRGGSNAYPQSMFLSKNKKNNVDPCKPQFYYIKVGFKGVKMI